MSNIRGGSKRGKKQRHASEGKEINDMGKQYVGIIIKWETWRGFDKLASKRKIDTEDLINRALQHYLSENEVEIETKALKHKIESDLGSLCRTMNIAHKTVL